MIPNRSVPTETLLPHIMYRDLEQAIVWLGNAFGFVEHYRYGDPLSGAQMSLGNACMMLKQAAPEIRTPKELGYGTQSLTVFVEEIEAHFEHARSAGVDLVELLHETVYGELQYAANDLDGHRWLFSRHARNLSPNEWGATVVNASAVPLQPATRISPMLAVSDGQAAIDFYKAAFGATVLWQLGEGAHVVAGMSVNGAPFFLADEAPEFGTRAPDSAGFTTTRIELFVDDPVAVHRHAVAAGAVERDPVREHTHDTAGPRPIHRMLQGALTDPFGHLWLIGKFLE